MDNNMKLLAKIASRFNLIALIFQIFLWGHAPDPPRRSVLCTLFLYLKVIIFFIAIAFSEPPSNFLPCYAPMIRHHKIILRNLIFQVKH